MKEGTIKKGASIYTISLNLNSDKNKKPLFSSNKNSINSSERVSPNPTNKNSEANSNNLRQTGLNRKTPTPGGEGPTGSGGLTDRVSIEPPISSPLNNTLFESLNDSKDGRQTALQNKIKQIHSRLDRNTPQPTFSNSKILSKDKSNANLMKKPVVPGNNLLNSRNIKSIILKNDYFKSQLSPSKMNQSKILSSSKTKKFDLMSSTKSKILSGVKASTKSPKLIQKNICFINSKAKNEKSIIKNKVESELNTIENNRNNNLNNNRSNNKKENLLNTLKISQEASSVIKNLFNKNLVQKPVDPTYAQGVKSNNLEKAVKSHLNHGGRSPVNI